MASLQHLDLGKDPWEGVPLSEFPTETGALRVNLSAAEEFGRVSPSPSRQSEHDAFMEEASSAACECLRGSYGKIGAYDPNAWGRQCRRWDHQPFEWCVVANAKQCQGVQLYPMSKTSFFYKRCDDSLLSSSTNKDSEVVCANGPRGSLYDTLRRLGQPKDGMWTFASFFFRWNAETELWQINTRKSFDAGWHPIDSVLGVTGATTSQVVVSPMAASPLAHKELSVIEARFSDIDKLVAKYIPTDPLEAAIAHGSVLRDGAVRAMERSFRGGALLALEEKENTDEKGAILTALRSNKDAMSLVKALSATNPRPIASADVLEVLSCPTKQGIYTYDAGVLATPLYFRFNARTRLWQWSPDQANWMHTSSLLVTGGRYNGKKPVIDNMDIINALEVYSMTGFAVLPRGFGENWFVRAARLSWRATLGGYIRKIEQFKQKLMNFKKAMAKIDWTKFQQNIKQTASTVRAVPFKALFLAVLVGFLDGIFMGVVGILDDQVSQCPGMDQRLADMRLQYSKLQTLSSEFFATLSFANLVPGFRRLAHQLQVFLKSIYDVVAECPALATTLLTMLVTIIVMFILNIAVTATGYGAIFKVLVSLVGLITGIPYILTQLGKLLDVTPKLLNGQSTEANIVEFVKIQASLGGVVFSLVFLLKVMGANQAKALGQLSGTAMGRFFGLTKAQVTSPALKVSLASTTRAVGSGKAPPKTVFRPTGMQRTIAAHNQLKLRLLQTLDAVAGKKDVWLGAKPHSGSGKGFRLHTFGNKHRDAQLLKPLLAKRIPLRDATGSASGSRGALDMFKRYGYSYDKTAQVWRPPQGSVTPPIGIGHASRVRTLLSDWVRLEPKYWVDGKPPKFIRDISIMRTRTGQGHAWLSEVVRESLKFNARKFAQGKIPVLGKSVTLGKPGALGPNEFKFRWLPLKNDKINWDVNEVLLRHCLRNTKVLRVTDDLPTGFFAEEVKLLQSLGWAKRGNLWHAPH